MLAFRIPAQSSALMLQDPCRPCSAEPYPAAPDLFLLQGARDYRNRLPPLHFRAASANEPVPYLAQPVFSSCTVPVVYYR